MGNPRGQLPQFRQLLLADDPVLAPLEVSQRLFQFIVLLAELLGKPPHRVQLHSPNGVLPQASPAAMQAMDNSSSPQGSIRYSKSPRPSRRIHTSMATDLIADEDDEAGHS